MKFSPVLRRAAALSAIAIAALSQTAAGQTKEQQAIRDAGDKWQRDIAADNVDAIVALHAPDAILMFSNAPLARGSKAVRDTYTDMVKLPGLVMHWTPTKIEVTSPTTATEYGTYTDSYDTPSGKMRDAGNYVVLWKKIDGKWRVALDAPSTTTPLPASMPAEQSDMVARTSNDLKWTDFSPPGFPPGAKISVLHGDPFSPGQFVLRLQLPDGYQVPLHWHPTAEYVTVVSGVFQAGMGTRLETTTQRAFNPGDFVYIPPRQPHFAQARGTTVVQVTGNGPFQLNLGVPR